MTGAPLLFDRDLLRRRLERAAKAPADFLLTRAAEDLAERLGAVLRPFETALDLGTPGPQAVRLSCAPQAGHASGLRSRGPQ